MSHYTMHDYRDARAERVGARRPRPQPRPRPMVRLPVAGGDAELEQCLTPARYSTIDERQRLDCKWRGTCLEYAALEDWATWRCGARCEAYQAMTLDELAAEYRLARRLFGAL